MSSTSAMPQLAHTTSVSASLLLIIILPTKALIISESTPKDIGVRDGQQQQSNKQHNQMTQTPETQLFLLCTVSRFARVLASSRLHSHQKSNDDGEKIKPPM
jgi:hypothetical protein